MMVESRSKRISKDKNIRWWGSGVKSIGKIPGLLTLSPRVGTLPDLFVYGNRPSMLIDNRL